MEINKKWGTSTLPKIIMWGTLRGESIIYMEEREIQEDIIININRTRELLSIAYAKTSFQVEIDDKKNAVYNGNIAHTKKLQEICKERFKGWSIHAG